MYVHTLCKKEVCEVASTGQLIPLLLLIASHCYCTAAAATGQMQLLEYTEKRQTMRFGWAILFNVIYE